MNMMNNKYLKYQELAEKRKKERGGSGGFDYLSNNHRIPTNRRPSNGSSSNYASMTTSSNTPTSSSNTVFNLQTNHLQQSSNPSSASQHSTAQFNASPQQNPPGVVTSPTLSKSFSSSSQLNYLASMPPSNKKDLSEKYTAKRCSPPKKNLNNSISITASSPNKQQQQAQSIPQSKTPTHQPSKTPTKATPTPQSKTPNYAEKTQTPTAFATNSTPKKSSTKSFSGYLLSSLDRNMVTPKKRKGGSKNTSE